VARVLLIVGYILKKLKLAEFSQFQPVSAITTRGALVVCFFCAAFAPPLFVSTRNIYVPHLRPTPRAPAHSALGNRPHRPLGAGGAGAQRTHLEGHCGPTTPLQATPLRTQTHQSPTRANACTASARRAQPGSAELRRGAVQGALARSGHTLKAAAGQARNTRPGHCAHRRIRAPHGPKRAQQALGVRNQGVQSCGEAPCKERWRAADIP